MFKAIDISFSYGSPREAIFQNYSFDVEPGKVMAVLGPNGQGKTTLVKCLLNLLPLNEGDIKFSGHKSYVPQNALTPFDYEVREMVVMGCNRGRGVFAQISKKDYQSADEALDKVGMRSYSKRGFAALSGGQKQMVLIARALASRPDIMILDEPTSALDFKNQNRVLNIMKDIAAQGQSVIFTTHCPHQALYVSDQALIMKSRNDFMTGSAREILTTNNLSSLYGINIHTGSLGAKYDYRNFVTPLFD